MIGTTSGKLWSQRPPEATSSRKLWRSRPESRQAVARGLLAVDVTGLMARLRRIRPVPFGLGRIIQRRGGVTEVEQGAPQRPAGRLVHAQAVQQQRAGLLGAAPVAVQDDRAGVEQRRRVSEPVGSGFVAVERGAP